LLTGYKLKLAGFTERVTPISVSHSGHIHAFQNQCVLPEDSEDYYLHEHL